jgi:hypothetical protein
MYVFNNISWKTLKLHIKEKNDLQLLRPLTNKLIEQTTITNGHNNNNEAKMLLLNVCMAMERVWQFYPPRVHYFFHDPKKQVVESETLLSPMCPILYCIASDIEEHVPEKKKLMA